MRTVQLNKGTIDLPTDWTEVAPKLRIKGFELLAGVITGAIDPFVWQVTMLQFITGYRPSWRHQDGSDIIIENLRRLAELLTFAFTVQDDGHIELNYDMHDCPVQLFGKKGIQPHFIRNRIIETNLTAGMYADSLQLLQELHDEDNTAEDRQYYMHKLARILWRVETNACVPEPTPGELLAVTVWFTGVALFFQRHNVYSVLFETNSATEKPEDYISLGVQEIILELAANGRPDARDMDLLEFFDAQIKMLKDRISDAKANGTSTADLVRKTGLPLNTVLRLS